MDFPNKLSQLRREKGLSQKQAAAALSVSQALLSHYENGIREPGLDFLRKAAAFYGVTSDWLLDLSETRLGEHEIFSSSDTDADYEMRIRTLFRCMIRMSEEIDLNGKESVAEYEKYISLCLYRYFIVHQRNQEAAAQNAELYAEMLLRKCIKESSDPIFPEAQSELPLCMQTVVHYCEAAIRDSLSEIRI